MARTKKRSPKRLPRRPAKGGAPRNDSFAVIFDMDGVLVDNGDYHFRSWQLLGKQAGFNLTKHKFLYLFSGRPAEDCVRYLFKRKLSSAEVKKYSDKKELIYRRSYAAAIRPLKGLLSFLIQLKREKIVMALASSAPKANIQFVFKATGTKKFFSKILGGASVKRGKPFPDIYLKTARQIGVRPSRCVVFEDAPNGILAAKRAGMKVVGVTTRLPANKLKHTDFQIKDFSRMTVEQLEKLFC